MRTSLFIACAFIAQAGAAEIRFQTPNFSSDQKTYVPIDIESVDATIELDVATKKMTVRTEMTFHPLAKGYPYFSLKPQPESAKVDGVEVVTTRRAAAESYYVRTLETELLQDKTYVATFSYTVSDVAIFSGESVGFFSEFSDLEEEKFAEVFLPSNREFDQFEISMNVFVANTNEDHGFVANGKVQELEHHRWQVDFPNYFTASSMFFHVYPKKSFVREEFQFQGIERVIPATVYTKSLRASSIGRARAKAEAAIAEFEGLFGPYPHASYIVYVDADFQGGMEHAGATISEVSAIRHETNHQWFARCIMPANGNAGWVDEAIASWSDNGFPASTSSPSFFPVKLSGFSPFQQSTNMKAYTQGASLIAMLNGKNEAVGMKAALKSYFEKYAFQTVSVDDFQSHLEQAFDKSLQSIFDRFVYGKDVPGFNAHRAQEDGLSRELLDERTINNPYHKKKSREDLRRLAL